MNIQDIKRNIPVYEKEYFIGQEFDMDGRTVILLSLCQKEGTSVIWLAYKQDRQEKKYRKYKTNRQELLAHTKADTLNIEKFIVNGKDWHVDSMSWGPIREDNIENLAVLYHFLKNGAVFGRLETEELENIILAECSLKRKVSVPKKRPLVISVVTRRNTSPVPVKKKITVSTEETEKPRAFRITGKDGREGRTIYIDGLKLYDIWEEAKTMFSDEKYKKELSEEDIDKLRKDYMEALPHICPRNKALLVLEYEWEGNLQAEFYTKEFLQAEPGHNSSATSMILLLSGKEKGKKGFKKRTCILKPVEKFFEGTIETELLFYYEPVPQKVFQASPVCAITL